MLRKAVPEYRQRQGFPSEPRGHARAAAPSLSTRSVTDSELSAYREALQNDHYLYLETGDTDFDWIGLSCALTGMDIEQQYGNDIFPIRFEAHLAHLSDSRGRQNLLPHTEASDYAQPPRYLALWCQRPAECGGGETTLLPVADFLASLTPAEHDRLLRTEHYFGATRGVHAGRTAGAVHPVLTYEAGKPVLRFSCNYMSFGDYSPDPANLDEFKPDPFLADISTRLVHFFDEHAAKIMVQENALLIWDNECMIHSRTTYTDPLRRLDRIFLS
ncbi:MAG: TauD/TfdA family dioxygenase [Verrucomicrobiota bacterium]